jgi:hypothetical protein
MLELVPPKDRADFGHDSLECFNCDLCVQCLLCVMEVVAQRMSIIHGKLMIGSPALLPMVVSIQSFLKVWR